MSTLHLVRQSAFNRNDFQQCIDVLAEQDTMILMDDGCYNLKHPLMTDLLTKININVITMHAQARAVEVITGIKQVSMADVVTLTFTHNKVITWQ